MMLLRSVLALANLLVTQASAFGDTGARNKTNSGAGAAVAIGIICYSSRKKPIGGWLLYYYNINLYVGLAISLLLLATTIQLAGTLEGHGTVNFRLAGKALGQLILTTEFIRSRLPK
jgi:hypothetical protein